MRPMCTIRVMHDYTAVQQVLTHAHMYIVPIAIFAQSILGVSGDIVLWSDMDAQMQQEESSSEETYEELEDLVSHVCGQIFGDKVKKLRSYKSQLKKIKDQQKETKKLLHHWKDKCLGARAELSQLEDAHQSVRSELMELQAEHENIVVGSATAQIQTRSLKSWV